MKITIKKPALAIGLFCALLACGNNSRHTNNNLIDGKTTEARETKDSFLNSKQGEWICYKYEIEDEENRFAESYAKEFTKYAYFTIYNDTLSAVGIYNTLVYSYKYPVKQNKYNEESVFITALKPVSDSVFFISPFNSYEYYRENGDSIPYYKDAPMNKIQLFLDDDFVISDRGYIFFFKRGERESSTTRGVPGDDRNYFRVEKVYEEVKPEETLSLIKRDLPHGFEQVMDAVNKEIFLGNDWINNNVLKLEKSQNNGKFVMEITSDGYTVRLLYYSADDVGDDEYPG